VIDLAVPKTVIDWSRRVRRARREPRILNRVNFPSVRLDKRELAALGAFAAVTVGAPAISRFVTPDDRHPRIRRWYKSRRKSPLTPPAAAYGPVWTGLYTLVALAGWRVWRGPRSATRTWALRWWAAQLGLNAAWSPIFFGRRAPGLALADLIALSGATAMFTTHAHRVDKQAARMMFPYLGWLAFAAYLNAEVVRRNR
jgi:translocator protein